MIPERWKRVDELFNAAKEMESEQRGPFLVRECGDDRDLRLEIESLLAQPTLTAQLPAAVALAAAHERPAAPARLIGRSVGHYKVLALIATGGMGEVYRAHDTNLGRDVALKILPHDFKADSGRLRRFDQEKHVLAALNHPNIAAIYGFVAGEGDDSPALVLELVDGVLADRIAGGPMPLKDALSIARQIADALDAAHEKGIIHRDLKPRNIALNRGNTVKVLDFGLAKTTDVAGAELATTGRTVEGMVLGTASYMSPEQARGQPVDKRTDVWAFGCVVYEMLAGRKAFSGGTVSDILAAVLEREPDWSALPAATPPNVRRLLERCLEKDCRRRLHDIADARLELDDALTERPRRPQPDRKTVNRRWRAIAVIAALLLAGTAAAVLFTRAGAPTFEQLTFSRGRVGGARFASGGVAVVYSAANEGRALEVARVDLADSPSGRPLNHPPGSDVLAVRAGEVALSLRRRYVLGERFVGTLALAPLGGGAPREVAENIEDADWDVSSGQLAVVRSTGESLGQSAIEFPIGKLLYKTTGSIRFLRVSRDGQRLAFLEDLLARGVAGHVSVADRAGNVIRLTGEWDSVRGLAWSAGGEIWFTAGAARANRALRAVTLDGKQRLVFEAPGSLTLWDIAADGRLLLTQDEERRAVVAVPPGESAERDLSLFDDTGLSDISEDGRWILLGDRPGIYLRATDGSPPIHLLNDGFADAISPNGKTVLATTDGGRSLVLVPTGSGSPQPLPKGGVDRYRGARWFPNGRQIFFTGSEPGKDSRSFIQDLDGGLPKPFTPEGSRALAVSPAGDTLAVQGGNQEVTLWPVADGPRRALPGSQPGDRPVMWSADGKSLWVFHRGEVPAPVYKVDIATGLRQPWKMLVPLDAAGVYSIIEFRITPKGDGYAYSYARLLSRLYLVRGLAR